MAVTQATEAPVSAVADDANRPAPRAWASRRGALLLIGLAVAMLVLMVQLQAAMLATEQAGFGQPTRLRQGGDSYVYWVALRALRDGRDPYSAAVTRDVQVAILGSPDRLSVVEPHWQAFVYPLPVVLWYLPTLGLDLEAAGTYGRWLGLMALLATVALGVRLLGERLNGWTAAAAIGLLASQSGVYEQFALGQNAALFLALALAAALLYHHGRYGLAGGVLALAMLKPQHALLLAAGLGLHALWARSRWGFFAGAAAGGGLLVGLGWLVQPGWVGSWLDNLSRYSRYNADYLQTLVGLSPLAASLVRVGLMAPVLALWWRRRRLATGPWLAVAVAAALAMGVPAFSGNIIAYNLLLLWPAMLVLLLDRHSRPPGYLGRIIQLLNVVVLILTPALAGMVALGWAIIGQTTEPELLVRLSAIIGIGASLQVLMLVLWTIEQVLPERVRRWQPGRMTAHPTHRTPES